MTDSENEESLEIAPEAQIPEQIQQRGFLGKLKRGLFMTHTELLEKVSDAMEGRATLDQETLEYLEEVLISADLGVETALELVEAVKQQVRPGQGGDIVRIREILADEMAVLLLDAPQPPKRTDGPLVTLMVGVNGVGKTTTIAKLAKRSLNQGEKVLLAAGDTFRAAAIEQLQLWGERLGVGVVSQSSGADPAAVVFDALQAARARGIDHLIVDTAGRLHTKEHLMKELAKIRRVVGREAADWQVRTLLVLDATTGQNALSQARQFTSVAEVDGVILSKMDGTAKGGMAVAVARDLRLPVLYIGVGEAAEDLVEFRPREFASALIL
ncbi:MAG: signal recognition particle-docking protein FtsY [Acidobacteriota bacterium]|nr:signal recognition particle-docking protein FtsY [Acidobacteriota bacterium]